MGRADLKVGPYGDDAVESTVGTELQICPAQAIIASISVVPDRKPNPTRASA